MVPFWPRFDQGFIILQQILARLAPAVSIDIPDLAVRTAKAEVRVIVLMEFLSSPCGDAVYLTTQMEAANAAYLAKRWPEALEHFTNAASAVPESTQYRVFLCVSVNTCPSQVRQHDIVRGTPSQV